MIGWLLLLVVVAISTSIWPVAKWALAGEAAPRVMGFWLSLTTAVASAVMLLLAGGSFASGPIWWTGAVMGVAYSVGFILLILRCLQIGPTGPTVTINNASMICGVLYGLLWLQPHAPNRWVFGGAVGVLVAMVMVGSGKTSVAGHRTSPRWKWLVLGGGLLSGLSFMTQTYMGLRHPGFQASLLYCAVGYAVSALILLGASVRSRLALWRRRELVGGVILGLGYAALLPLTLRCFHYFSSEIVLPVTVASPMVLTLVIGAVAYRERLTRWVWAGCLLAAASVAIMAWGSGQ